MNDNGLYDALEKLEKEEERWPGRAHMIGSVKRTVPAHFVGGRPSGSSDRHWG